MSYAMKCPKCHAAMRTYNRSGVQIEQCDGCRGIFLDYGELEALTRLEGQWAGGGHQVAAPPPPVAPPVQHVQHVQHHYQQPAWGHGHRRHGGVFGALFST